MDDLVPDDDGSCTPCRPSCEPVFDRVVVSYLMRGGTRVMWELLPTFTDDLPYSFQLQVGQTASNDADDWEDVGLPVVNAFLAVDGEQRVWTSNRYAYYRVKLTTPTGVYLSQPVSGMGTLIRRDWLFAKEIARQEMLRLRQQAGQLGYLLKRRVTGERCPVCLDYQTQEITDPACPTCYGTGFRCGYFFPADCVWAEIDPKAYRVHLDGGQARGTVNDIVVKARMVNPWMISEGDVWVNQTTDDRYYCHSVQHLAEVRGVPVVARVELRPAPVTDVIYSIDIPQQLSLLGFE
jgi:hypothetical protein